MVQIKDAKFYQLPDRVQGFYLFICFYKLDFSQVYCQLFPVENGLLSSRRMALVCYKILFANSHYGKIIIISLWWL